jgi:hypothetical protein
MIQPTSRSPAPARDYGRFPNDSNYDGFDATLLLLSPRGLVSFDTEHMVEAGNQYDNPLDRYNFTTFVFVVEKATNTSVPITVFAVGDIGPGDFTTTSTAIPTKNQVVYDTEDGSTTVEVESSTIFATIKHSIRTRALTFSMFAINWVLTLCSVTIASIVVRRRGKVEDGVALLPITVILSTPTIRNLYVGSPPLGVFLGTHRNFHLALPRRIDATF